MLDLTITDLSSQGDGLGRWNDRVVFVPNTVPGDLVQARLVRVKRQYAHGQLQEIVRPSPQRVRAACIVADKCGGCQWQPVAYAAQLDAKRRQVIQSLERIGGFQDIQVAPVLAAPSALSYRNKVTYPVSVSQQGQVQAGYYRQGSHQVVNLNQCPVQDTRFNSLMVRVKQDIQRRGWSIYNETTHRGQIRHFSLRVGRRTGELLLTLVLMEPNLPDLKTQAQAWMDDYPNLVGVLANYNPQRTNVIFGPNTDCVAGRAFLREQFAGLQFHIQPHTFFQIYTEQAESLLQVIGDWLQLQGREILLDAYCGIGTLTLPLARQAKYAIGLELQAEAVAGAMANAKLNRIENVTFHVGDVAVLLPQLLAEPAFTRPDILLLDPPRKGCAVPVLDAIRSARPERIVYVSCNPATLARDLQQLCQDGLYQMTAIQPADFFPQTHHVECAVLLCRNDDEE